MLDAFEEMHSSAFDRKATLIDFTTPQSCMQSEFEIKWIINDLVDYIVLIKRLIYSDFTCKYLNGMILVISHYMKSGIALCEPLLDSVPFSAGNVTVAVS